MNRKISYPRLLWAFLFAFGSLLIFNIFDDHKQIEAAYLQGNGGDPALESLWLAGDQGLVLSDTLPGAPDPRPIYFNNAQAGTLTLSFEISGTAPLTLSAGAAFGYTPTLRITDTAGALTWQPVITYSVPATATTENGVRYTITNANALTTTLWLTYNQDIAPPTLTLNLPSVLTTAHQPGFALTGEAGDTGVGVAQIEVQTEDAGHWDVAQGTQTWLYTWTLPDADHVAYTPTARATDHLGNQGRVSQTVIVDTVAPTTFTPVDAGAWSPTTTLAFTWDAAQDSAGVRGYYIDVNGTGGFALTDFTAQTTYTVTAADGITENETYTACIQAEDTHSNRSAAQCSDGITTDLAPPINGSVEINDGDRYANTYTVTLSLNANDAGNVKEMCLSEEASCDSWVPYQKSKNYTLSGSDGLKTVYAWYRDQIDNTVGPYTDTIFVDTHQPQVTVSIPSQAASKPVAVGWKAEDPTPSSNNLVYSIQYREDNGSWQAWLENVTITTANFVSVTLGHTYTFSVTAQDAAGNIGQGQNMLLYNEFKIFIPITLHNYAPFTNGSFENLQPDMKPVGWTMDENNLPVMSKTAVSERDKAEETAPVDGEYVVLLGNPNLGCDSMPIGYAAVKQTFVVPEDVTGLRFNYVIWSQDASVSNQYNGNELDRFEVYVTDTQGQKALVFEDGNKNNTGLSCQKWWRVPGAENLRDSEVDWAIGTVDLNSYQGQMITISFENHSRLDHWYNTYTYIDNVTLTE